MTMTQYLVGILLLPCVYYVKISPKVARGGKVTLTPPSFIMDLVFCKSTKINARKDALIKTYVSYHCNHGTLFVLIRSEGSSVCICVKHQFKF